MYVVGTKPSQFEDMRRRNEHQHNVSPCRIFLEKKFYRVKIFTHVKYFRKGREIKVADRKMGVKV